MAESINKTENKTSNAGFTLIEIILVLVITGTVFIAIYSLYVSTVKQSTESRNELIAAGLAQEGVEIIRNARDNNFLSGDDINQGLTGLGSYKCYPEFGDSSSCNASSENVCIDGSDGHYYNGSCSGSSVDSHFKRRCDVSGDNTVITASCVVTWDSFVNNESKQVEVKSVMTDWQ